MGNQRLYYRLMDNKYVDDLIWQVESFLQSKENMICQRILCENSNYTVLQAKLRGGKIKQFIGMDKALTVRFICLEGRKLAIEMGEAKWGDKGAVMVVSMFVLWPLAITAGVGIYRQKKLPQKIIDVADGYLGKENRVDSVQLKEILPELTEKVNEVSRSMTVQKVVAKSDKIVLALSKIV